MWKCEQMAILFAGVELPGVSIHFCLVLTFLPVWIPKDCNTSRPGKWEVDLNITINDAYWDCPGNQCFCGDSQIHYWKWCTETILDMGFMWLRFKSLWFCWHFDHISQTGSRPKLGWKKCRYNYLEEIGRREHLPLPATMPTKITKALAEGNTGHVLALFTLNLFQEPMVRNEHSGVRLRGRF